MLHSAIIRPTIPVSTSARWIVLLALVLDRAAVADRGAKAALQEAPVPNRHSGGSNNNPTTPQVVPPQNPNLPDPSAALYPPGGTLTLQAANYWYMNGGGKPAVVGAMRLDFSAVNPNGFNRKTGRQLYTSRSSMASRLHKIS